MCTGQHLGNACQLSSQVQRHTSEVCQRNVSHSHLPLSGKYQKKLCYHNRYLSTLQTPHILPAADELWPHVLRGSDAHGVHVGVVCVPVLGKTFSGGVCVCVRMYVSVRLRVCTCTCVRVCMCVCVHARARKSV
jgi:hypothetical protein